MTNEGVEELPTILFIERRGNTALGQIPYYR